jgi:peptidoglycan/LPS O-acetylase OafA/YrhL
MIAILAVLSLLPGGALTDRLNRIVLNVTFTFGFMPSSGLVWGGWSVGVEMIFYGIFPVLLLLIKTHRSALTLLLISIVVSVALRSALHVQYMNAEPSARFDWSYFSFAPNLCFFAMGIYVYRLSQFYAGHKTLFSLYAPIATMVIIGALVCFDAGALRNNSGRLDIVLWGFGLSALCAWQGCQPSRVIASYALEYLGERSFSIYLLHPVIVFFSKDYLLKVSSVCSSIIGSYSYFICAIILMIAIWVAAEFTYRFIEVPGINLGRRLIASRKSRALSAPLNLVVSEYRN